MKTVSLLLLVILAMIVIWPDSKTEASTSEYSRCKHSAETKFMIQVYREKYKAISDNQIAHIICEKK